MRYRIFLLIIVSAFSSGAVAADAMVPDPQALGRADAMVRYCSKAAPDEAGKYEAQVARLVRNVPAARLVELRASSDYFKTYNAVVNFHKIVNERNAKRACSVPLVASR